jgi:hypothetical protein
MSSGLGVRWSKINTGHRKVNLIDIQRTDSLTEIKHFQNFRISRAFVRLGHPSPFLCNLNRKLLAFRL